MSLPWQKMGTDVTKFTQPCGKAYFAPMMISVRKKSSFGPFQDMLIGNSKSACLKIYYRNCLREHTRYFIVIWDGNISSMFGWTSCRKMELCKVCPVKRIALTCSDRASVWSSKGWILHRTTVGWLRIFWERTEQLYRVLEHSKTPVKIKRIDSDRIPISILSS